MSEDRDAFLKRLLDDDGAGSPDAAGSGRYERALPTAAAQPDGASYLVADEWDSDRNRSARSMRGVRRAGSRIGERLRLARGGASAGTKRATRLLVFALAVVGALAGLAIAWIHVTSDPLADVRAYFDAATRLNHGQPLYPATADTNAADFYRYPPLLAVALRPFAAFLPYEAFAALWELGIAVSFVLLLRTLGVRSEKVWLAIGILGIPIGWALSIGQAQVPLTLLVAIGQPWSIALAANLKLFPALVLLWWLGRRDYQAAMAFLLWSGLLVAAQVLLEPGGSNAFIHSVGLDEVGDVRNISPYALSPALWAILLAAGAFLTYILARGRWGWSAAVALATLSPPRLLVYALMTLLASVREPAVKAVDAPSSALTRVYSANS